ncbi:hypothetical protein [Burkholderia orbicola]|uniref:hypothetical protein n=1 Tax=Burkholderia orbicola TaxID=2978683 RepID=UPI003AF4C250
MKEIVSYEAVLDSLRHVCYRQVVRYRHEPIFDALMDMRLIVWVRQPIRLSQLDASVRSKYYRESIEIAELTLAGRAVLHRLVELELLASWAKLRSRPYDKYCGIPDGNA